ncbi:MAG: hypothetical protein AB1578_17680 [Thermodesulfobacteriota bacterium]|jgi:hypothetical protein
MNVVEKDPAVRDMLSAELARCREMVAELEGSAAALPRGSLSVRKKRYKDREYSYHSLKYREGSKVISRHVAAGDVEALAGKLERRRRYEEELRVLRTRIAYLEKLLGVGKG